jgi:hypothetical protein
MMLVVVRLLVGMIAFVALILASRHIIVRWNMRGKEYLVVFLVAVAVDNLFTSVLALEVVSGLRPVTVTWRTLALLLPQMAIALSGAAFCAFLLGLIGYGRVKRPDGVGE